MGRETIRFEAHNEAAVETLLEVLTHQAQHGAPCTMETLHKVASGSRTREEHFGKVLAMLRADNDEDEYVDADLLCAAWRWTGQRWPHYFCAGCWIALDVAADGDPHATHCGECMGRARCLVCKVAGVYVGGTCEACANVHVGDLREGS